MSELMKNKLVDIIYQALNHQREILDSTDSDFDEGESEMQMGRYGDLSIKNVSLGSDHKSSEVIITLDDGEQKKDFVISNNDIREIE